MFEEVKDAWALTHHTKQGYIPSKIYKYTGGKFPNDFFIKTGAYYTRILPRFKNASWWGTGKNGVTVVEITPHIEGLDR